MFECGFAEGPKQDVAKRRGRDRSVLERTYLRPTWCLCLLCIGCDSKLDANMTPLEDRPFSVSLLDTRACPLPEGLDPEAKRILGVKVRVTSAHEGRVPANYFYASVLTKDGDRYLAELPGCRPVLSSPPLEPGHSAEGFLNFPLPVDKQPEQLNYAPNLERTLGAEDIAPNHLVQEIELP